MDIFITGGSGFVGTALASRLLDLGHCVTSTGTSAAHKLSGHTNFRHISADTTQSGPWQEEVKKASVIINLAGANIFHLWTEKYKEKIYLSRIGTTRHLVAAIPERKKVVFCSTSAAGFYGDCGDEELNEDTSPGIDFLAKVCVDWETEASKAENKGARVVLMRFGVVLGQGGGALSKMVLPFKMFVGGPLGNGKQWFPWIHLEDLIFAIVFLFENSEIKGPINFCAPQSLRQGDFARAMGKVLKRPSFLPSPAFVVKTIIGELGTALMNSQRAVSTRLQDSGYTFKFPEIDEALKNILEK